MSHNADPRLVPVLKVAREGWPIVGLFVLISAIIITGVALLTGPHSIATYIATGLCLPLCVWCVWFFRDPERATPTDAGAIICPADGVVCAISVVKPEASPPELELPQRFGPGELTKICVFMNVFNVHVNRAPVAGVVEAIRYHPGAFLNASFDKASDLNERNSIVVRTPSGLGVAAVQIAGLVARRIVSRVKEGQALSAGERFGLIRFGSRVDVYVPGRVEVLVKLGQKTVAGETILARVGAN